MIEFIEPAAAKGADEIAAAARKANRKPTDSEMGVIAQWSLAISAKRIADALDVLAMAVDPSGCGLPGAVVRTVGRDAP